MLNYHDELPVEFEEDNQTILMKLLDHIGKKQEGSLSDYILDFCDENSYKIEEVAFLIKDNKYIRGLLKEDCIFHGILKNTRKAVQKIDEW